MGRKTKDSSSFALKKIKHPRFFPLSARAKQARCTKIFLRILEHAGQLLNKFQAVPLTRSRGRKVEKFQKPRPRRRSRRSDFRGFSTILSGFFAFRRCSRARKASPMPQNFFAHTRACGATPAKVPGRSLN